MKTILETSRLILREYTVDDAAAVFRLNSDPEVMRYVPDQPMSSIDEARNILISHPIADYKQHGFGRWACLLKSTDEHIGFCGLKYLPEFDDIDLGFRFARAYWNKGFATEASRAVIRHGFEMLGHKEIVGLSHPDNHASIRVLEKVGMQYTGMVRLLLLPMRRYLIRRPT